MTENNSAAPAAQLAATAPVWGEQTYTLLFPIPLDDGNTVTKLVFREPNGEALEAIDELGVVEGKKPTVRQALGMVRALANVPKVVTDRMHQMDITRAMEAVGPLLDGVV
jgi:hypothetical protein